jgi:RND family efflux transporter MFP subunit
MEAATENRQPGQSFWDMAQPMVAADRLADWLDGLFHALSLGRAVPLRLSLEVGSTVALVHPLGRVALDATLRAGAEAQRQGRLALAGHLPGSGSGPGTTSFAVPMTIPGHGAALLTVEADIPDNAALDSVLTTVALAMGWIHATLMHAKAEATQAEDSAAQSALQSIVAFITHGRFSEASRALMTDFAGRYRCDRVALGLARGSRVRVVAISNTGSFSRSLGLARKLRAAMEEAYDQERVLLWPVPDSLIPEGGAPDMILDRQAELATGDTGRSVLSVPLFDGRRHRGVILFERGGGVGFTADEVQRIVALCALLTPIIIEKRDNNCWLIVRAAVALGDLLRRTLGRSHLVLKASVLAGVLTVAALFVIQADRDVVAEAVVQGTEVRTLAAPFSGFVAEAPKREGDHIRKGDILVRLDDRELTLELTRLIALRAQTELELDKVMSERNRAEAALTTSRLRQIDAQVALAQQQIDRSRIEAPFDGLVTAGDLTRSIGKSVEQGEPLLVIAPLTEYRVDLYVPEDQIDLIHNGQTAALKVTPLPERSYAVTLRDTMPVARYENGGTRYQVEARFTGPTDGLVPGMTGAVRVAVDRQSLAQLWFGPLVDRARLWLWRNMAL